MSPEAHATTAGIRAPFEIHLREDDVLRGDAWAPPGGFDAATGTAIVVCHGFKGFKDWGFFPYVCRRLAADVACLTVGFNFSGSGVGEDLERFTELEKFSRNTFSREIEDLGTVIAGLREGRLGAIELPPAARIGLLGHSRGGAIAILAADRAPDVRAVVTWSSIFSVVTYERTFGPELDERGVVHVLNARTGQRLPLRRDILDDLRANREALDVAAAAGRIGASILIVHGGDDETVPSSEARALHAAGGADARLEIIAGAGHTLDSAHPFPGPNRNLDRAIDLTAEHFRTYLPVGG